MLAFFACFTVAQSATFDRVKNFRRLAGAAAALPVFRCATLDEATAADVAALQASAIELVVDLRNDDERRPKSPASRAWHASIDARRTPLLGDVDAFWVAVADLAPPPVLSRVQMLWSTKPLEAALARNLEDGGNALLYRSILSSAPAAVAAAVDACVEGEGVVFHCQKGKDRTGIVAALLEEVVGVPRAETVASYGASGALLGGDDAAPVGAGRSARADDASLDWSRFRGSPPAAMGATLAWLDAEHGGAAAYLEASGVSRARQARLRARC